MKDYKGLGRTLGNGGFFFDEGLIGGWDTGPVLYCSKEPSPTASTAKCQNKLPLCKGLLAHLPAHLLSNHPE